MHKDYRQLVKKAQKQGWKLVKEKGRGQNGHPRLVPPGGGDYIVIPTSPSDWRSVKNTRAELRRRGCRV